MGLVILVVLLGIALVVAVYGVMLYNNLVQVKHNVTKAWANIDVLLKQRHDELPKLVDACKESMKFEQETLAKVSDARAKVVSASQSQNLPALGAAEGALRAGLGKLVARVHRRSSAGEGTGSVAHASASAGSSASLARSSSAGHRPLSV